MPEQLHVAVVAAALLLLATGCGDGQPDDQAPPAARRQAEEKLNDYGLTEAQAACVVERLGADTVVEAGDLNALAESATYQAAARACTSGS